MLCLCLPPIHVVGAAKIHPIYLLYYWGDDGRACSLLWGGVCDDDDT